MQTQLAVLGGGPGGYAAAFMAADLGMDVVLVEADPRLGGTCLLRGCIPSKALLHVARVLEEAREMAEWGVAFNQPKLKIEAMRARKEKVIETLSGGLRQLAKQRKVRVVHARAVFESSQSLVLMGGDPSTYEGDRLAFEHCILATGSVPAKIPAFDLATDRVMDSTGALALPDIPKSLLVVGGGYIGLELGTVYAELGTEVTVVELTSGLLPGADRDLVRPLANRLKERFKAILLDTKVASLADKKDSLEVELEGKDGKRKESFSRVLVSVGRKPNSAGLGLENTQVELDKRGFVTVDRQQRTADPKISAIGDVAGEPMLAHKATHEGKVAVEALLGESAEFDALAIPAVVFTDPEIAWAGLTEEQAQRDGREIEVARYPWAAIGKAQALGRTEGVTKLVIDPHSERILGIGICGVNAGDLISEGVLAIEMGCTVRDITESIHPHPTLSETIGAAGDVYFGLATEIYRPRREAQKA
ncbi:MAG: dihydrolipoyl dehydrogenase [Planctomycetia bacterium]|nr:dihydrolipoyl dehydrogenase [Planctomycetia bacterium]